MKISLSSMQKSIKRAALLVAVACVFSANAWAEGGTTGPLTWNLTDSVLTISGTGDMPDYSYLDNEAPWRSYSESIKTTVIEDGVSSIGNWAFSSCSSLTSVTIPNSVTTIGNSAFSSCSSLEAISIPNSVTNIGDRAFYECHSLASITIPNSVTSIGEEAFYGCRFRSIAIPENVTSIGERAFRNCGSLTSIHVAAGNSMYSSEDGVLFNKNKTILITFPAGKHGEYLFPNSVTSIGNYAFSGCSSLTSITIPNSVTSIGEWAFLYCYSLTSITIPNSVTSIGDYAFVYCYNLTSITIPNSVTSIGEGAFSFCSGLTSITIPNSVISIGDYAFSYCSSLASVTIHNGVKNIGDYAFFECHSLTSVTIPNSVTSIGDYAFSECNSLASVTIPEGVKNIGERAFFRCNSLASVTIPNSVTSIGDLAFNECASLTSIYVEADNKTYSSENGVLFNKDKTVLIIYPADKDGDYYLISSNVTSISEFAFDRCFNLTSIIIPTSITSIEFGTFIFCIGLTSITIPNSVTSIGRQAFLGCSSLVSVTIPNSVTNIGEWAFYDCSSLTSITIPNSVTSIGNSAFYRCESLAAITNLNPAPQAIEPNVFYNVDQTTCILTVRNSAVEAYKAAEVWKDFANIVGGGDYVVDAFPNNVTFGTVDGSGLYEANATVYLTATANSGCEFENWTSNGVVVSTENPYTFTVTSDITLTANFKSNGTSINHIKDPLPELSVYPNPATNQITISAKECRIESVALFNQNGQQLKHTTNTELHISNLPTGLYFIQVRTDKGMVTKKIIKE